MAMPMLRNPTVEKVYALRNRGKEGVRLDGSARSRSIAYTFGDRGSVIVIGHGYTDIYFTERRWKKK